MGGIEFFQEEITRLIGEQIAVITSSVRPAPLDAGWTSTSPKR
ncbi:hypothetical protein [Sorangium sp. So ce394]